MACYRRIYTEVGKIDTFLPYRQMFMVDDNIYALRNNIIASNLIIIR